MTDEEGMQLAIEEARDALKGGGNPIGAIIVKHGEVIAKGKSMVWPDKDPSAHAESYCIRLACKNLDSLSLKGCTMYSTLESCSMCLGCAAWAGLSRIVFGAYKEDIGDNPYEIADYHAEETGKKLRPFGGGSLEVKGGCLREECIKLVENMENWFVKPS